jgi:CHASE2 domain-containing sensor protein
MIEIVMALIVAVGALAGYAGTRRFVRERLRFVDAVHRGSAPFVAGAGAALLAAPVAWLLPAVGTGAALVFGGAVGWGVVKGRRDVRKLPPGA